MWIREALADPPRGGRLAVAAAWLRTVLLAIAAVGVGVLVDHAVVGPVIGRIAWERPLLMLATVVGAAAAAGALAEALPGRMRGREEASWRERVMSAAMAGELRSGGAAGAGGRPSSARDPRQRAGAGAHPSSARSRSAEGAVLDAATVGVEKTAGYRASFLAPTLASFTSPLLVLVAWAMWVDALSAAVLAGFVALVPVVIVAAGRRLRSSNHAYRAQESAASARYVEMIEGLGTLSVLGAAPRARDAFAASARAAMRALGTLLAGNQRMIAVNDLLFGFLMTGAAVALLLLRLDAGALTAGQAFSGLLLAVLLAEPIDRIGRSFYVGLAGRARRDALERMLPAAEARPARAAVADRTAAAEGAAGISGQPSRTGLASDHRTGPPTISLRGVGVELGGRPALHGIDLDLPAGAHIALVGPTGAGKSTLLRVLGGAQPATGEILVDGRRTGEAELRAGASVVAQRAGLLSSTIGEDLRLAAPEATDEELHAALARARLDLAAFPAGLDTPLGDRGAHLSGGQRRRLVLARALLRPRPLLLLDEATADLDRRTEALVRETLAEHGQGRTVVQVAHRLDMITGADLVVVLRDGRIEQVGTPAGLAARAGYVRDALAAEGER